MSAKLAASSAAAAVAALVARRYVDAQRPPRILHAGTPVLRRLVAAIGDLLRVGRAPSAFELNGLLSTVSIVLRLPPLRWPGDVCEQELTLDDGGLVRLTWSLPAEGRAAAGAVLVLPGLNNSSGWAFVRHAMARLSADGFAACCLDYRGVGGLPLKSGRLGAMDSWRDLAQVLEAVRRGPPGRAAGLPLFALGFSMGGLMLAKHLSTGRGPPVRAAATVSSPLEPLASVACFEGSLAFRAVNAATTQGLKLNFLAGWAHHASTRRHVAAAIDWHALLTACSLREAEEALLCPLHGYADANAYYRACTPDIEAIATPLLVIHAEDDPVIGLSSVPLARLAQNPHVLTVVTPRGGHLGYGAADGALPCAPSWSDELVARWFAAVDADAAPRAPSARL